jgi:DNA-directed RNA polymerase specialized sigma24 family protein
MDPDVESLYREYWARLVRIAWMMCRSREDAEDIVHDAFVRLSTGDHEIPKQPLPYLRQIVVNLVRDRSRRRTIESRRRPWPADPVLPSEDAVFWDLMHRLPLRQRQALVLRICEGLPLSEIATLLECPTSTAKSLIHRGLIRLRKELSIDG